jgi:hypothetical protein
MCSGVLAVRCEWQKKLKYLGFHGVQSAIGVVEECSLHIFKNAINTLKNKELLSMNNFSLFICQQCAMTK